MSRKKSRVEAANEAAQISLADSAAPTDQAALDRARIDAEPVPAKRSPLHVGSHAWFIDAGRWFEIEIVERSPNTVTVRSVTGWNATGEITWPFGDLFEFNLRSPIYKRLFPMSARRV